MTISLARGDDDLTRVRALFQAYAAAIDFDLAYQGFEAELADLPGRYAPPAGAVLLARDDGGQVVGGVGVRPHPIAGACELKRLYVIPAGRGSGAGRALALAALSFAATAGYRQMRLDTLPKMGAAIAHYRALGFEAVPAPADDAGMGQVYFAIALLPA